MWEGVLDRAKLTRGLNREIEPSDVQTAITTGSFLIYTAYPLVNLAIKDHLDCEVFQCSLPLC